MSILCKFRVCSAVGSVRPYVRILEGVDMAFSLYTVNCPSPYTVGLLPLLLDWWPSPCTAGLLPILFALSLYCWPSPYTVDLLPILLAIYTVGYSVGLVECGYGILLAFSLGYSN